MFKNFKKVQKIFDFILTRIYVSMNDRKPLMNEYRFQKIFYIFHVTKKLIISNIYIYIYRRNMSRHCM